MTKLFPEIIDSTAEFIKQNGFAAQCRRTNDTGYSSRVSIREIREYLYAEFPNLKEHSTSLSTIRRIFEAPNKSFASSFHYRGIINARVGTKSNSYGEYNMDAHHLFSCCKMRQELASLFSDSFVILSVDDMAKSFQISPAKENISNK